MADELVFPNPVLGFRAFVPQGENLASIGAGSTLWRKGENISYCHRGCHHSPASHCHCGFNAYHAPEDAFCHSPVIGAIVGRGKCEIHSTGLRVERAQIIALYGSTLRDKKLKRAAEAYNVPYFTDLGQFKTYSKQYASPAPQSTRPTQREDAIERRRKSRVDKLQDKARPLFQVSGVLSLSATALFLLSYSSLPIFTYLFIPGWILLITGISLLLLGFYISPADPRSNGRCRRVLNRYDNIIQPLKNEVLSSTSWLPWGLLLGLLFIYIAFLAVNL